MAFFSCTDPVRAQVSTVVRMLLALPRGKDFDRTLGWWQQAIKLVTADDQSLPFQLLAMPLADFNDRFEAELDTTEYTTLGGFLFGQLGRLPKVGDRVTIRRHTFVIAAMQGKRVGGVKLEERAGTKSEP